MRCDWNQWWIHKKVLQKGRLWMYRHYRDRNPKHTGMDVTASTIYCSHTHPTHIWRSWGHQPFPLHILTHYVQEGSDIINHFILTYSPNTYKKEVISSTHTHLTHTGRRWCHQPFPPHILTQHIQEGSDIITTYSPNTYRKEVILSTISSSHTPPVHTGWKWHHQSFPPHHWGLYSAHTPYHWLLWCWLHSNGCCHDRELRNVRETLRRDVQSPWRFQDVCSWNFCISRILLGR